MMDDEPTLFDATPVPRLQKGDRVLVQTMWGQEEAVVVDVHYDDGYPMVSCDTESGDCITLGVARVVPRP